MPTFTIAVNNKVLGTYVVKRNSISVGRSRLNTISIASKAVSRNHFRIELTSDGWFIADLGALNGTFVNDVRVNNTRLYEGDRITIGAYGITFSPEPIAEVESDEKQVVPAPAVHDGSETDVRVEDGVVTTSSSVGTVSQVVMSNIQISPASGKKEAIAKISQPDELADTKSPLKDVQQNSGDMTKFAAAESDVEIGIKKVIAENPLADTAHILQRLKNSGNTEEINMQDLENVLKKMGLESALKRYQFFLHS